MPGSDGSGSGSVGGVIDVAQYVKWELMKNETPLKRLMRSEKEQEVQISRYGNLKNLVGNFQTSLQALNTIYSAVGYQVTSSNNSAVTATVTSNNVAPVTHTLNVAALAQAETQISQGFSSPSPNLSGSISIAVGSQSASVTINATDSLQNIRDNINQVMQAANINATASLFNTNPGGTPQYQLIISSDQTGVANAVTVTDTANLFNFTEQNKAQDASFTIDNQSEPSSSSSNIVTNVVDGLTINLLPGSQNAGPVTLSVIPVDQGAVNTNVTNAVQGIMNSYNAIMSYIDRCEVDPRTRNETFPLLKLALQEGMSSSLGEGAYQSLVSIGIVSMTATKETATLSMVDKDGNEVQKDVKYYTTGQLQFTQDTNLQSFSQFLQDNPAAVQSLLTNATSGIFTYISNTLLDPQLGTVSKSINEQVEALSKREDNLKQDIADENVRLNQLQQFYTDKYAKLNVLLSRLQSTSDRIYKQIEQAQIRRD